MNISSCPYLGMQDDPETQVSFPSQVNLCHHLKNPGPVSLEYQRTFCQTGKHVLCAIFPEGRYARLPAVAQIVAAERPINRRPWLLGVVLALILFIIVGGMTLMQFAPGLFEISRETSSPAAELPPLPPATEPASAILPSLTATSSYFTPTAYIPAAASPSGTVVLDATQATATYAPLGLETPIGANPKLLIHRVLPGENLDLIAARFETNVEAIQAINYFLPSPLWADLPLVVPLAQVETAGLPQFEAYQVSATGVTVEQFSQNLDVDVVQLRKYNLLPEGATLVAGQWLLLPRPSD